MPQTQLSIPLSKDQAFQLVDAIMEREDMALSATARENEDGGWVFEAICGGKPDLQVFNDFARHILGGQVNFALESVDPDIDWVAKSLEGLKPVVAGGFYVHGSHDTGPAPAGVQSILIDAAQAFGTGHHETTTGCLEAINAVLKIRKPLAMLDVGTGTGVLAIALAKRTNRPVIASDIDPVAVATTSSNARLNGVANRIISVKAAGLDHRTIRDNGPFDLIVANILAGPLKALAPAIGRMAQPGASVILSGILQHQAARIISAYAEQDIVLTRRLQRREWTTLWLTKAGSNSAAYSELDLSLRPNDLR